jgi:hypothetical protein
MFYQFNHVKRLFCSNSVTVLLPVSVDSVWSKQRPTLLMRVNALLLAIRRIAVVYSTAGADTEPALPVTGNWHRLTLWL